MFSHLQNFGSIVIALRSQFQQTWIILEFIAESDLNQEPHMLLAVGHLHLYGLSLHLSCQVYIFVGHFVTKFTYNFETIIHREYTSFEAKQTNQYFTYGPRISL